MCMPDSGRRRIKGCFNITFECVAIYKLAAFTKNHETTIINRKLIKESHRIFARSSYFLVSKR